MNDCYIIVDEYRAELPCYPEEISDGIEAQWSDVNIVGRSSPISAYTGTSYRHLSFNFDMHREMMSNDGVNNAIRLLRASVFPQYLESGLKPTISIIRLGEFKVRGIVRSVNMTWKKPIIDRKYQVCSVSISIDQIPDMVYGFGDVYEVNQLSKRDPMNPFNVNNLPD